MAMLTRAVPSDADKSVARITATARIVPAQSVTPKAWTETSDAHRKEVVMDGASGQPFRLFLIEIE